MLNLFYVKRLKELEDLNISNDYQKTIRFFIKHFIVLFNKFQTGC